MPTPRRTVCPNTPSSDATNTYRMRSSYVASMVHFLQRPHSLPFVLSIFLFLTWISLRLHRASMVSPSFIETYSHWSTKDDINANLVRFGSGIPSAIVKDKRGWLLDPVSLASTFGISGGAITCASIHVGEIRPGKLRGNHRHHDCNETLVIWGATTRYRLENRKVPDKGYGEVTIGLADIAVAASPSGTAHVIANIDSIRSTFFIGCQDNVISYNASSTDFNVWKDL